MNRKAFTLVELVGVVTLLGIISILVVANILNQIRNSKESIDKVTEELIYSGTDLYLDNKLNEYPKVNNNVYCITLEAIVDEGKLTSPIVNASGDEISLNKYVKVEVKNKEYTYKFVNNCVEERN